MCGLMWGCALSLFAPAAFTPPQWQELLASGEWVPNWPSLAKRMAIADHQHRESDPLHFVMGRTSMFYIERAFKVRERAHCMRWRNSVPTAMA
jgi:hypothetical protein